MTVVGKQLIGRASASAFALAAGFAVTIGLTRVFLGHHWLTDVLLAWTLGAALLAVVITVHRLHLTLRRKSRNRNRQRQSGVREV